MTQAETLRKERSLLAEDHLPLVAAMVRRFPGYGWEREELYQQGCVGLMKAIARYDPHYGTAFSTYAAAMILGEMRRLCRTDAPVHIPRTDREKRSRIRHAQEKLTEQLGREPTISELAMLLRMEPTELVLAMEDIHVTSLDAPTAQGTVLADLLPDGDDWMKRIIIKDLMNRLSEEDRKLMFLRYRLGLSQTETAHHLGITQTQVSRREASIRSKLRTQWQAED